MNKKIKVFVALVFLTLCLSVCCAAETTHGYKYVINDAHCHFVNFIQESDGAENLLEHMNASDIENIVLFGLPVTKLWTDYDRVQPIYYDDNDSPAYYYALTDVILAEAVKKLPKDQQNRIYPMICGFNPVDRNAISHIKKMVKMYPDFWVGIGEILTRHDDLTRMTYGRNPTANSSALDPVYDFAAENNMPIWMHSDIGDPVSNRTTFLYEIEEAVKNHPKTKFVWCHIGVTRDIDIKELPELAVNLLKTYPNLYYDLSWVVFEQVIAPNGKPDRVWINIIEQFPDRFMIGSDKIGGFSKYEQTIRRYDVLLDQLKPETAKKVAYDNMFELVKKKQ